MDQDDDAHAFQLVIGMPHGVEIDADGDSHLTQGRHLVTGPERARGHPTQQLVAKLDIDRHTRRFETQAIDDLLAHCMHTLIQYPLSHPVNGNCHIPVTKTALTSGGFPADKR